MKVVAFRFTDEDGPTGWVGFATGQDWTELFWTIDEFGDPYCCEYKTLSNYGVGACWRETWKPGPGEHRRLTRSGFELSELVPDLLDEGWKPFPSSKVRPLMAGHEQAKESLS